MKSDKYIDQISRMEANVINDIFNLSKQFKIRNIDLKGHCQSIVVMDRKTLVAREIVVYKIHVKQESIYLYVTDYSSDLIIIHRKNSNDRLYNVCDYIQILGLIENHKKLSTTYRR